MKRRLLCATLWGVLGAQAAWAQWEQSNGPDGGRVVALSVNATSGIVFAVANDGAFRSTDGGVSWTPLLADLPGNLSVDAIGSFGTNTYLAGYSTGSTPAIYHSTDDGDSWIQKGAAGIPANSHVVNAFAWSGGELLAGFSGIGVVRSSNDGEDWTASNTGLPANISIGYFTQLGAEIYAGSALSSSVKGVFRSSDGGASWTAAVPFLGTSGLTGLSANAAGLFASTNVNGVHSSTNNGASWVKINPVGIPATNFPFSVLATSANLFTGYGSLVYRGDANGDAWEPLSDGLPLPAAGQSIPVLAVSANSLLAATNGLGSGTGIHRSTDNGNTWTRSHTGLRALKINSLLASGTDLYAAGDGQGFFRSADNGESWIEINIGIPRTAGWLCLAQVGAELLGGTSQGTIYRSSDQGNRWRLSSTGFGLSSAVDFFVDGNTVYAGGSSGVAKSTDGGLRWATLPTGFAPPQVVLSLWKSGTYVLAGSNLRFRRSSDEGASWDAPFSGLPVLGPFAAMTQSEATIFVATGLGVYRSGDDGATWSNANSGITGAVTALAADSLDLYAGTTSNGVFHSSDNGSNWAPLNDGFPSPIAVHKLAIGANSHLFAGATHQSVWSRRGPTAIVEFDLEAFPSQITLSWSLGSADISNLRRVDVLRSMRADGPFTVVASFTELSSRMQYVDRDVRPGTEMWYSLRFHDQTGATSQIAARSGRTMDLVSALDPPRYDAGDKIVFSYAIGGAGADVQLVLYDVRGRLLRHLDGGWRDAGRYEVEWSPGHDSAGRPARGVYFARLNAGAFVAPQRVIVLREPR